MKAVLSGFLLLVSLHGFANAAEQGNEAQLSGIEEVVISERRPGPPLWRLENGENTLWVFAVVSPMPKSFEWDSSSITHVISGAQEYFPVPERSLSISLFNPIKAIGALRRLNKIKKNPKGESLESRIPQEEYRQFQTIKEVYAPKDKSIERLTPLFAAQKLYDGAKREHGLVNIRKIARTIDKIAKRNKVTFTEIKVNEKADTKLLLDDLAGLSDSAHLNCMTSVLKSLDNQIDILVNRALLWANGDANALVTSSQSELKSGEFCTESLMQNDQVRRIVKQSRELWLEAAQQALQNNDSSFAVLHLDDVIEPQGLLALLAQRGNYKLKGPVREPSEEPSI